MRQYRIALEGRVFDVKVLDDPRQEQVRVEVDGEVFTVGVEAVSLVAEAATEEMASTEAPSSPALIPAPDRVRTRGAVTAPLPGVIKSIAVRTGQQVASKDELLVIEAMKMDNVIRASRKGTIGTIYVGEGRQVAYGEPLLEID
jgi:biotin carboxyl carrier protein